MILHCILNLTLFSLMRASSSWATTLRCTCRQQKETRDLFKTDKSMRCFVLKQMFPMEWNWIIGMFSSWYIFITTIFIKCLSLLSYNSLLFFAVCCCVAASAVVVWRCAPTRCCSIPRTPQSQYYVSHSLRFVITIDGEQVDFSFFDEKVFFFFSINQINWFLSSPASEKFADRKECLLLLQTSWLKWKKVSKIIHIELSRW